MRLPSRFLLVLLSPLLLITVLWLFRTPILTAVGYELVEDDTPQKADVIVVLGGDSFGTRIVKAAQLEQAGYAPIVLVSGPRTLLGHESDDMIEYARRQGYPAALFRPLHNDPTSTRTETVLLARELQREGVHKILLVTSNYHTRRAARLMRQQAPWLQVVVVAAPDPAFQPDSWWKTRDGQKQFFFESAKTVATWLGD